MAMPTFINAKLPDDIEQGSQGGPNFLTTLIELSGGGEQRNGEWQYPRITWNLSYGVQSASDLGRVKNHFMVCAGRLRGFRFKDWSDYIIGDEDTGTPQNIGVGDAANKFFQVFRTYSVTGVDGSTVFSANRKVTRIVNATLKVYVNGVLKVETTDYTVNYDTGLITFVAAPGVDILVDVYCEFDIPVRFDGDGMALNMIWKGAGSIPPINVKELRE